MSDVARPARRTRWVAIALSVAAVAGFVALLMRSQALPQGPVPIVWDKEACAHCRMHVGEPAMAAQAQLADGRVLNFDDPGCMLSWLARNSAPPRAIYLHHHLKELWLSKEEAAFEPVLSSPMGFNLGAVEKGAPGSISFEEALHRVAEHSGAMAKGQP